MQEYGSEVEIYIALLTWGSSSWTNIQDAYNKNKRAKVTWEINFGSIAGIKTIANGLTEISEEALRRAWMNVYEE